MFAKVYEASPVWFCLGFVCFFAGWFALIAAAVVLIVWAARRSSRPTQPPVDFDEPREVQARRIRGSSANSVRPRTLSGHAA
jgi:hypothetical protein